MINAFQQFHEAAIQLGECIRQGKGTEEAWTAADMLGQHYSEHPLMMFSHCLSLYDTESMYPQENQEEILAELKESIFGEACKYYDQWKQEVAA